MTKADVITLIEASEALRQNTYEKEYWLNLVEDMDEAGLTRLAEVLNEEAKNRAAIVEKLEGKLEKIDEQHLQELKTFNKVEMPKFIKKWEATSRAKENPEDILNQAQL